MLGTQAPKTRFGRRKNRSIESIVQEHLEAIPPTRPATLENRMTPVKTRGAPRATQTLKTPLPAPTEAVRVPEKPAPALEPTKAQIRERAYFIYIARNGQPGNSESDWLQAERELRAEARQAARSCNTIR